MSVHPSHPPHPARDDDPPAFPGYEIVRELGRGGMGVVYLARNTLLDRTEVLKVLGRGLLDKPGAAERFLQEIQTAGKLNHPNVVAAYAALRAGDALAFAMEYVPGQDLAAVLKDRGPLPVANACYYAFQAAQGLQHAHDRGMVHRDIKPSNLMLAKVNGKTAVKVLDFGLGKATRATRETGLTVEGRMLGTPAYMAPEQAVDAAAADIRADIYSLGCTLFHLLTGRPPFASDSWYQVVVLHQTAPVPSVAEARPGVPPGLAEVVANMMVKNPAARYQTPAEVGQALRPFFVSGKAAKPDTAATPTLTPAAAPPAPTPPPSLPPLTRVARAVVAKPAPRRPRRRRWVLPAAVAGAAVAVLLAVGAGVARRGAAGDGRTAGEESDKAGPPAAGGPPPDPGPPPAPARVLAPEKSEWAGIGIYHNQNGEHTTGGSWTIVERRGKAFKVFSRSGLGYQAYFEGLIEDDGRLTLTGHERLKPEPMPKEACGGTGEIGTNRLTLHIEFTATGDECRLDLKRLPDAGEGFTFPGRWLCFHQPGGWKGLRTATDDAVITHFDRSRSSWERDGGLITVRFPNGGREWLVIDPDRPNELQGSNGNMDVTWRRQ